MTCNFGTWSSHGICNGGNSNTRTWINSMLLKDDRVDSNDE
jgi:hypothetical protein